MAGIQAYAGSTSVPQGGTLAFHLNTSGEDSVPGTVTVTNLVANQGVLTAQVEVRKQDTLTDLSLDRGWAVQYVLPVPNWPSGIYKAVFTPGAEKADTCYFV